MIEDWVYGALKSSEIESDIVACMQDRSVYALGPDLKARGIDAEKVIDGIEIVDYDGFVKLAADNSKVQSWL